jgi:hypothetical protein
MINLHPLVGSIKMALKVGKPVLVVGDYGTGKTTAAIDALNDSGAAKYYNVNSEFGPMIGPTHYELLSSLEHDDPIIFDEIDMAHESQMIDYLKLFLTRTSKVVCLARNESKINPDVMALMNPKIIRVHTNFDIMQYEVT